MITIFLFPDSLITASVLNYGGAKRDSALMRRLGIDHCTLTHGYFLDMGGFVIRSPEGELTVLIIPHLQQVADAGDMNIFRKNGQLSFHDISNSKINMDLAQACLKAEWLHELRRISEAAINKLAKSDTFAKAFACLQAIWLLTQVLSRAIQGLSVTLLELATVAFVGFGIAAYALWWKKPQDCSGPIIIQCKSQQDYDLVQTISKKGEVLSNDVEKAVATADNGSTSKWEYTGGLQSSISAFKSVFTEEWTDYTSEYVSTMLPGICWFLGTSCLLGAIHCIAWNFHFPTPTERFLWRISALAIIVLPFVWFVSLFFSFFSIRFDGRIRWTAHKPKHTTWIAWLFLLFVVYFVARMFLIVELFLSLRELPASAFTDVDWSTFVPHI